jgi:hypothetical protein
VWPWQGLGNLVPGVSKLVQFFSIAAFTQVILMLSQLVLLPIQIRIWGHSATAAWYSAVALATITTVVDCGLRTAGHAELVRYMHPGADDLAAKQYFRQIWGWIRVLILVASVALIAGEALFMTVFKGLPYPIWKAALTFAYALETILNIRIGYLDSLGRYRGAEGSYFLFATLRLALAVPALLVLRLGANGLAWLFLATSALALALQGWLLCRRVGMLGIFAAFPRKLSARTLAVARHTLAEPCANWVRLSLPVLVIAAFATPAAVTTYVALRAAFGAGRATIQQLSRVASVEYLRFRAAGRVEAADSLLSIFVLVAVSFGTVVAGLVIADNMRILGLWLAHFDRATFQTIAISFALCAPFFAYQIMFALMFRAGELAWAAKRHWAYVVYSALFAVVASRLKWLPLYLIMLVVSEIALSATFMLPGIGETAAIRTRAGRRGVVAACTGLIVVLLLWLAARSNFAQIFADFSFGNLAWTLFAVACGLGGFSFFAYLANTDLFKTMPLLFRRSSEARSLSEEPISTPAA